MHKLTVCYILVLFIGALASCNSPIINPGLAPEQQFVKMYGGEEGQEAADMMVLEDGFLLLGSRQSFGDCNSTHTNDWNIYLVKTNKFGDPIEEWSYDYWCGKGRGDLNAKGYALAEGHRGGYVICGEMEDTTGFTQAYFGEIDSEGNILWDTIYGQPKKNEIAKDIIKVKDGYVMVGVTNNIDSLKNGGISTKDESDFYVKKLNTSGKDKDEWTEIRGFKGIDTLVSVQEIGGDYYVLGMTDYGGGTQKDFSLTVLTSDGGIKDQQNFGTSGANEIASDIIASHADHPLIIGYKDTLIYIVEYHEEKFSVIKELILDIPITKTGAMSKGILADTYLLSATSRDNNMLLVEIELLEQINESAQINWIRDFGGSGPDEAVAIEAGDNFIALFGTQYFLGNRMMTLIKTDREGKLTP